jgi:membrane protease YdiL (CAAX protease family)
MQRPVKDPFFASIKVFFTWFSIYVAGSIAATAAIIVTGQSGETIDNIPVWVLAINLILMWSVYLVATPRLLPFEEQHPLRTYRQWFSSRDVLIGVPLGIFSQLVLVNLVNWPLSRLFPDTFSFDDVSQRARDIVSTAPGAWLVLLVLLVAVGAPIVEEIVYRGCLQTQFVSAAGAVIGVVVTAVIFAAIHLSPVEFPALFVFALLLGFVRQKTGTLGLPIVTHFAFNATGLLLVSLV